MPEKNRLQLQSNLEMYALQHDKTIHQRVPQETTATSQSEKKPKKSKKLIPAIIITSLLGIYGLFPTPINNMASTLLDKVVNLANLKPNEEDQSLTGIWEGKVDRFSGLTTDESNEIKQKETYRNMIKFLNDDFIPQYNSLFTQQEQEWLEKYQTKLKNKFNKIELSEEQRQVYSSEYDRLNGENEIISEFIDLLEVAKTNVYYSDEYDYLRLSIENGKFTKENRKAIAQFAFKTLGELNLKLNRTEYNLPKNHPHYPEQDVYPSSPNYGGVKEMIERRKKQLKGILGTQFK